jgi:hypothetical protein
MHKLITAALLAAFAITALAIPASAYVHSGRENGWALMVTNQYRATRTLVDRTPGSTIVGVHLQKKPGPTHCRASVTVRKNGRVWKWRNLQKWARTYSRVGVWRLNPNTRDRTVSVTVTTNGRCVVGVGIK